MKRPRKTVEIQTLANPAAYTEPQVTKACRIAAAIGRPCFLLCEPPEKCVRCYDEPETFCTECGLVAEG